MTPQRIYDYIEMVEDLIKQLPHEDVEGVWAEGQSIWVDLHEEEDQQ